MATKIKNFLFLDFETFYDPKNGYTLAGNRLTTPEYILDARFSVILLAVYDIRWSTPKILLPHEIPDFLRLYPPAETMACSFNALFDLSILAWKYGWVPAFLQDSLGMARALLRLHRYSLGAVLKELKLGSKGDTIMKVAGLDTDGIRRKGLWSEFCNYALNDVEGCAKIYFKLLPQFPIDERRIMDLVLRCAIVPKFHADIKLLDLHLKELRQKKEELLHLSGFQKAQLMSTEQFKSALENLGVEIKYKQSPTGNIIPQFAKTDKFMEEIAEHPDYRVQVLAQARLAHKSTIEETRAQKFLNIGRLPWGNGPLLPVALRYGGAHTHRLSGEWGLNLQNLPRDKDKSKLRHALRAPAGSKVLTADLSQIECRLVAWTCHQNNLLDQFRANQDVYANFATLVFQRYCSKEATPHERFIGKTGVLGLGYGCGPDRFYRMVVAQARQLGIQLGALWDENLARRTVATYRRRFDRIPAAWRLLDIYLERVLIVKGHYAQFGPVWLGPGSIQLPDRVGLPPDPTKITKGSTRPMLNLRYGQDLRDLYGAMLLENIVQALARQIIMDAALRLSARGYRFVLQAHDELVFLVPDSNVTKAKEVILQEMVHEPVWAKGLPLAAEIGVGQSYGEAK